MLAYIAALMLGLEDYMEWPQFERKYPGVCTKGIFHEWIRKYDNGIIADNPELQNRIHEFQKQMNR